MREQADFLVNNNKSVQRTLVVGGPFMSTDKYPSTHVCISAPNGRYGLYNMEQILPINLKYIVVLLSYLDKKETANL